MTQEAKAPVHGSIIRFALAASRLVAPAPLWGIGLRRLLGLAPLQTYPGTLILVLNLSLCMNLNLSPNLNLNLNSNLNLNLDWDLNLNLNLILYLNLNLKMRDKAT